MYRYTSTYIDRRERQMHHKIIQIKNVANSTNRVMSDIGWLTCFEANLLISLQFWLFLIGI